MNQTEQTLLSLLARGLFGAERAFNPESVDWAALLREAEYHTVTPLIYDSLTSAERACMPAELLPHWQRTVMATLWQNEQIAAEQRHILSLFSANHIPCLILKGSSSAMNYPKPELRCSGDIDLLLSRRDLENAQSILCQQGYRYTPPEHEGDGHRVVQKGPFVVELHHAPSGLPDSPVGKAIRDYFQGSERRPEIRDGLPVLQKDRRTVLLSAHKLDHVLTSGLGLRHLCDWAVFVHREVTPEFWAEMTPVLKAFGLHRFGLIATRACVDFLGLPIDSCRFCEEISSELGAALMEDMLRSGNFGRKENRYGQRLFTDPGSSSPAASFFASFSRVCREKWPVCEKYPILLPVAPAVLLWRYAKQRKDGLRPALRPAHVLKSAGTRQHLFKELRAFVPEDE